MALDFPASPVDGEIYKGFVWDNTKNLWRVRTEPFDSWATIDGTATGTFTDANGLDWNYFKFTADGSLVVSLAGYADCLVVGGGGSGNRNGGANGAGGAGGLTYGMFYLPAGTHAITVGAGGTGSGVSSGNPGSPSSLGTILQRNGGGAGYGFPTGGGAFNGRGGAYDGGQIRGTTTTANGGGAGGVPNAYDGLTLNYTGSDVEYSRGGTSATPPPNTGWGGDQDIDGGAGSDGVVIVKVRA